MPHIKNNKRAKNHNSSEKPEAFSCCGTTCNRNKVIQEHMTLKNKLTQASKDLAMLIVMCHWAVIEAEKPKGLSKDNLGSVEELVSLVTTSKLNIELTESQVKTVVLELLATVLDLK